jgi:hypothetical protein
MVDELAAVAARFNVARAHVGQLDVARSILSQFIEQYRSSDEVALQVLEEEDACRIEEGDPPVRPPMWSTKQVTPEAHGGPWIASNGRWHVRPLAPGGWRLEPEVRRSVGEGGRWKLGLHRRTTDTTDDRRGVPDELGRALVGAADRLLGGDRPRGVLAGTARGGHDPPTEGTVLPVRVRDWISLRHCRHRWRSTDLHLGGDPDRRFRTLDPATPLHRAIERAAVGETVMVDAPRPYPVTIVGIDGTPPEEAAD